MIDSSITLGQFNVLFLFVTVGAGLADALDLIVSLFQLMKTGAGRLNEVLLGGPRREARRFETLPEQPAGVELHRAAVRIGEAVLVDEVDLRVEPGGLVVVTGPAGSGKSTVAGLASGSLAATSGLVVLDGVDIQRIDPDGVRVAVHLVSEDPFLFGRSLRDNLLMGVAAHHDPEKRVSDDELVAAIEAAGASDVLADLSDGLDTVLGDRGLTLSGGQRQRLALARALVEPPRVLVLDDALSAVSPSFEIEIIGRIRRFAPQTALLCVGRRESLASIADTVVTLPERTMAEATSGSFIDDAALGDAVRGDHRRPTVRPPSRRHRAEARPQR